MHLIIIEKDLWNDNRNINQYKFINNKVILNIKYKYTEYTYDFLIINNNNILSKFNSNDINKNYNNNKSYILNNNFFNQNIKNIIIELEEFKKINIIEIDIINLEISKINTNIAIISKNKITNNRTLNQYELDKNIINYEISMEKTMRYTIYIVNDNTIISKYKSIDFIRYDNINIYETIDNLIIDRREIIYLEKIFIIDDLNINSYKYSEKTVIKYNKIGNIIIIENIEFKNDKKYPQV